MKSQVDWYGDDLMLLVDGDVTDEIVTETAFYVEGKAKARAPVDTGFMRNAIYSITPLAVHREQAEAEASAVADRELAPEIDVPEHAAGVHAAAGYTIYQEEAHGFLYGALQAARRVVGGIIVQAGKRIE